MIPFATAVNVTPSGQGREFPLQPKPISKLLPLGTNLRNPALHKFLGTLSTPGLSDYLLKPDDPMSVVKRGESNHLMLNCRGQRGCGASGTSQPSAAPAFNWVLIDSPPAIPFTDAALLANQCEGVLLVVRSNSTRLEVARQARREFREGDIAGVVLNGAAAHQNYVEIH